MRSEIAVLVARWRRGTILILPSVTSCRRIAVLVLCSVGRPINSVAKRLSTAAEDREGPEPLIASENLLPILLVTNVVERLVRLSLHLQVFNGRLVGKGKFDVEFEEHGHQDGNDSIQHEGHLNHDVLYQLLLVSILRAEVICVQRPLNAFKPSVGHGDNYKVRDDEDVNEEQYEKLAVPESNTVINPRTVMVHVEHTSVARRAMMASLWLENVTHQTITTTLILWVTKMEAPKDWNLSWVSSHRLYERPYQHEKEYIEDTKHENDPCIICRTVNC